MTDACLFVFFCFVFSLGAIVSTEWSYNVARGLIITKIKSSSALFK